MTPSITPPTDNLYKFMAIGGFILMILCFFYPDIAYREMIVSSLPANKAEAAAKQEIESYSLEEKLRLSEIKTKEDYLALLVREKNYQTYIDESAKYHSMISDFAKSSHDHGALLASYSSDMENSTKLEELDMDNFAYIPNLCSIGFIASFIVMMTGFHLWWRRVQIYQDYLLQKDAREKGYKKPQAFGRNWIRYKRNLRILERFRKGTFGKATPPEQ